MTARLLTTGSLPDIDSASRFARAHLHDRRNLPADPLTYKLEVSVIGIGTVGLTWYGNPYLRMKFNYVTGGVHGGSQNGRLHIFETRVEVNF